MQTLNVAEAGFLYIFKCIALYSGGCFYLLLCALALLWIFFKGDRREKERIVLPSFLMLLTVFNPAVPVALDRLFDVNKEYYRLFWILPVITILSYTAVVLITREEPKSYGRRAVLTLAAVLFFMGAGTFVYSGGYVRRQNPYKVPDEVIKVSEAIHEYADEKYPMAICDYNLHMELRQYDASILLAADRTQYLSAMSHAPEDDQMREENKYVNRLLAVVALGEEIPPEEFLESMNVTNTEFVVLSSYSPTVWYLEQAGLKKVAETGTRAVMHYDLPDPKHYDLADYSEMAGW